MSAAAAMKVAELWRYPVKTMAGEKLERARIGPLGIEGDRVVHVEDASGRVGPTRAVTSGRGDVRPAPQWLGGG